MASGKVVGGRVELDADLPEGAAVTVLAHEGDETFEVDSATEQMLLDAIAHCERGETIISHSRIRRASSTADSRTWGAQDGIETTMSDRYVEKRDGVYTVAGSRVSLDSVAYAFVSGQSAEAIAQAFPVLGLEQVYGAITYYLAHREELDRYLAAREKDFEVKTARGARRRPDVLSEAGRRQEADTAHPLMPIRFHPSTLLGVP